LLPFPEARRSHDAGRRYRPDVSYAQGWTLAVDGAQVAVAGTAPTAEAYDTAGVQKPRSPLLAVLLR